MEQRGVSEEHLDWLVKNRSRTQAESLKLYKLIASRADTLKGTRDNSTAQELVAVAFSLWRSVFLADKSGKPGSSLEDAQKILAALLMDNAINYSQDRASREWAFNYYAANAKHHLEKLQGKFPNEYEVGNPPNRAKPYWEYLEDAFEKACAAFAKKLEKNP